ncbi:MAG: helix-turn-helix domain-containing protein [Candidatus Bathyarchaeia archaeon]
MTISSRARRVLREVGLSNYEINAYVALLETGPLTAMEISKKANVPYSKVYSILNALKEKGWIGSDESRPATHYPFSPVEVLANLKLKIEDKYKSWEQAISSELQPLFEKRSLVERPAILILRGQQAVMAKIEETLKRASKEIMIAAPEFAREVVNSAIPFLTTLQRTHVNVKFMAAGDVESWKNFKGMLGPGEFRCRDKMFGGGIIVDGREAILFLGEEKPSLVIWSDHAGLLKFAREYFQFLWDSSMQT